MKRLIFVFAGLVLALAAHAYDYPYLTFESADGTQTAVSVESLSIAIDGGNLVATNSEGTVTLTLASLSKMFFAKDNSTGISAVSADSTGDVEIFTLAGVSLGKFSDASQAKSQLAKGIYLFKSTNGTSKVAVR